MTADQAIAALHGQLPGVAQRPFDGALEVTVEGGRLRERLLHLRDAHGFDFLTFVSAIDRPADSRLELIYRLFSHTSKVALVVRVLLPRDGARIDTVSDIYRTAEWHERETAEMFGIVFANHPDPRKLLLPDDLEGNPLRKDFTHPNLVRLPEVP